MRVPSGLKATERIAFSWPLARQISACRFEASQTTSVPDPVPLAIVQTVRAKPGGIRRV